MEPNEPRPQRQISDANPATVAVGGNVIGSLFITGNANQIFFGDYEELGVAYLRPGSVLDRVDLAHFAGREWLVAKIDAFLQAHDRGYLIIEAAAGLGKTTFLAWLAQKRGYIHHFAELAPGSEGITRSLKSLAAQIVLAHHLRYAATGVLPAAATRPDFLYDLLSQASAQAAPSDKTVLLVDALDEAGTLPGQNVLGLPRTLPVGVFIIVSQRPVPVTLYVDPASTPRQIVSFTAKQPENQADMRHFLERAATWPGIARELAQQGAQAEQFVEVLSEKCQGVWIYLHYVVHEIDRGIRSPLDMAALPNGMAQYYARYWAGWREQNDAAWYASYLSVLTTLAAAREAVSATWLGEWTTMQMPDPQLRRLLNDHWRPFLTVDQDEGEIRYRFYHATLHEFCDGQVDQETLTTTEKEFVTELATATRDAHRRIAEYYFQRWGGLLDDLPHLRANAEGKSNTRDRYGLRYLAFHLHQAGGFIELFALLDSPTWYAAQIDLDLSGSSYLGGVQQAWEVAVEQNRSATRQGMVPPLLIRELRCALATSTIHSRSNEISAPLFMLAVQVGLLPTSTGLAIARQHPDPHIRATMLAILAPYGASEEQIAVLKEALAAIMKIQVAEAQLDMLELLVSRMPGGLIYTILTVARSVTGKQDWGKVLHTLIAHIPTEILRHLLFNKNVELEIRTVVLMQLEIRTVVLMELDLARQAPKGFQVDLLERVKKVRFYSLPRHEIPGGRHLF